MGILGLEGSNVNRRMYLEIGAMSETIRGVSWDMR